MLKYKHTLILPLPFLCNSFGWFLTEIGRQPFIVYKLLTTEQAVLPAVTGSQVLASTIGFTLLYGVLAVVAIYLGLRENRQDSAEASEEVSEWA